MRTMPFSYDRFVNWCVDRSPQSVTVHVNVNERRGSIGSNGMLCDIVSPGEGGDGREDGLGGGGLLYDKCRTAR